MARPAPASLTLEGPLLTRACVDALAAQFDARDLAGGPVVVDCRSVREVDPAGLCALLDLAQARDTRRWVLVALTPPLLRSALEVGLAHWFAICRDADAAHELLQNGYADACGQ
jgi:ABC-type transporter Mla MlaB component